MAPPAGLYLLRPRGPRVDGQRHGRDVVGLGDDGHTASLVPGDPDLDVIDRDVSVSGDYRGYRRMTLTYPILNRARQRLWLVPGAGKAGMLARLRAGDETIPAGRVNAGNAVIFTDCKL